MYHKQYYYYGRSEEEQESGDEQESKNRVQSDDELESKHKEMRNMLYEAESLIRQELRAPSSYLYKYMKQRIQARHRIHQIFTLGNKLTSYINKELLKAKNNAYHQSKNSQNNNTVSPTRLERSFKEDFGMGLRFKRILPINSSRISQPSSIQSRICNYNGITPTSNTTSLIGIGYPNIMHAHFKFLRALSVGEFIDVHNIFLEIVGLVHLRWLNIHCRLNIHYLPLFMLRNLQKLEVYLYSSCEPLDIWGLPQLRNLHVSNVVTLVPPRSVHHNLKSIRSLDYRSCTKELFVRIPNLRTLAVTTDHRINPKCKPPSWFESLGYLYKLEELVVACKHLRQEFKTIHSMGMLYILCQVYSRRAARVWKQHFYS
nr:putative disease resistance RPP13-like protein 3 [Ipomoea batatas]